MLTIAVSPENENGGAIHWWLIGSFFVTMLDNSEDDNFQDVMNTLMFYGSDSVPETKAQIAADIARLERRWHELPPGSNALPAQADDQQVLTMLRSSPITGLAGAAIVAV